MLLLCALVGGLAVGLTAASDRSARRESTSRQPPSPSRSSPSRSSAGADAFEFPPQAPPRAWTSIVVHHSATTEGDVAAIDAAHRQQRDPQGKPWLGIGYHFVVGNGRPMGDGEIQPTFRWLRQLSGAHAGKRDYNEHGIGICLIGNFDEAAPTARQVAAVGYLLKSLAQRHAIPRERIVRHSEVQATACPGRLFPWEQLLANVPTKGL
jgi:hypothetical protein